MAEPPITSVDCLANSTRDDERLWKRTLFYILGYCDTVHDFQAPRGAKKEEGASLDAKDIPDRRRFILNVINQMDANIGYQGYYDIINQFRLQYKYGTFENTVFALFSQLINNPLIAKMPEAIQANIVNHLHTIYQVPLGEANQFEVIDKTFFSDADPQSNSSIIELTCPAVVYPDAWQDAFIRFIENIYPTTERVGDKMRFVEDAASFPRELLITKSSKFKKLVTLQTKWDPAGNSSFKPGSDDSEGKVYIAPSFRALKQSNVDPSKNTDADDDVKSTFSDLTSQLKYPGNTLAINNRPGPSVNHLFLHIARHANGLNEKIKTKAEILIKRSKIDSKKNMTLNLKAEKGNVANDAKYLREFTSSKRSGDYENIHSAMANNCILFTGDEPAFTYAVLNKQPVILHYLSGPEHVFRFYVPPPADDTALQKRKEEKTINALILKASELIKIFGASDRYFKGYLTNIQNALSGTITVGQQKSPLGGLLLKGVLYKTMKDMDETVFTQLDRANEIFAATVYLASQVPQINQKIATIETDAGKKGNVERKLAEITKKRADTVAGLEARAESLDEQLGNILLYLPRVYQKSAGSIKTTDSQLCVATDPTMTASAVFHQAAAGARPDMSYTFRSIGILPQFKEVGSSILAIAKTIRAVEIAVGPSQTAYRTKMIQQIRDTLEQINCPVDIYSLFTRDTLPTIAAISTKVSALEKGFNEILTAHSAAVRRGGRRLNVNRSRKQVRKSNKVNADPAPSMDEPIDYARAHAELMSLNPSKIPFGLSPQVYADAVVDRLIIMDTLYNEIQENKRSEGWAIELLDGIEEGHYEVLDEPDIRKKGQLVSKPMVDTVKPAGPDLQNEDPMEVPVQSGGVYSNEFRIFLVNLYYDIIEPYLRKHIWDSVGNLENELLVSTVAGSFIEDTLALLEELMNLPPGESLSSDDAREINNIRTNANTAHASIYTSIKQSLEKDAVFSLQVLAGGRGGQGTLAQIADEFIETNIFKDLESYVLQQTAGVRTLLQKLEGLPSYLQGIFKTSKLAAGNAFNRDAFDKAIDDIGEASSEWIAANKELLQINLKYAVLDQFEFEYGDEFSIPPAAPAGGRRQTRKKGKHSRKPVRAKGTRRRHR